MLDKEKIIGQLQNLERQMAATKEQQKDLGDSLHRMEGAIQLCNFWLQEIVKQEAKVNADNGEENRS